MTLGQTVITPNGKGIYQFPMWSEGIRIEMVSHAVTAEIDREKCQACYGNGQGIWYLCGYRPEEVKEL